MPRCVLVLGTGRSGTSAVAGVLHKLDCCMGNVFQPRNRNNRYGTFEDAEFRSLDVMVAFDDWLSEESTGKAYEKLIEKRSKGREIWGVKDPDLVRVLSYVLPHLNNNYRVVVCRRGREDTIASFMQAYNQSRAEAEKWHKEKAALLDECLSRLGCPVLFVDFAQLLSKPEETVNRIAAFAFERLEPPTPAQFAEAYAHIQRKDQAETGWGNVCIGVRPTRPWSLKFWSCWTDMIVNGLRESDTVLLPEMALPGHQAANIVTRAFLYTDADTLLFVDDDQVFEADTLEQLRSHRLNWRYDIVGPFVTHRCWPPKPVILRSLPEQPEEAEIKGEAFETVTDFDDGAILEVDAVGLAFTLVRRRVFEAMTSDRGVQLTEYFRYGPGRQGPDVPFCQWAKQLGFRMAVDTSVKIGHLGEFVMDYQQFVNWKAGGGE